ncbi:molecular chaperone DnaJ [Candidatus Woesearchaeota archaeon]|nr:molecular chaperone DnaJ [Candidatus Woesearchaeota archaeon]
MPSKDYYKILGVEKNASKEEIKKAYKRMAKQCHPDLNKHDSKATEKFKEINEAASILGDDQKRQQYDQYGTTAESFGDQGFSNSDFSEFMSGMDFDDIFDQILGGGNFGFGGRGGRRGTRESSSRGSDLRYDLEITLEDAAHGTTKTLSIPKLETCEECDGSGAKSSSDVEKCSVCNGSGAERHTRRTAFGLFQSTTTCSRCRGQGEVIKHPCSECSGTGRVENTRKLEVKIPAGVDTGTNLRVSHEGEAGLRGGGKGDLYVVIHVKDHDLFKREGNDLYVDAPIPFTVAALGGEIEVPTLDGKATLKIPSGTQPGTIFRMKGKGIPALQGYGTGNENVHVTVEVPDKLSSKQKELLEELNKTFSEKKGGFFRRIFE